jgi:hypothetical protein
MRRNETIDFRVTPPGKAAWVTLVGVGIIVPALLIGGVMAFEPTELRKLGEAAPILIVSLLLLPALGALMWRRSVQLDDGVLVVKAAFYTQRIHAADVDVAGARVLDLDEHTEFRPVKSNGYALPGFFAGHFRNGAKISQKFFCLLTDRRRVLVLPERNGRMLLLSLERPQALIDALQRNASALSGRR